MPYRNQAFAERCVSCDRLTGGRCAECATPICDLDDDGCPLCLRRASSRRQRALNAFKAIREALYILLLLTLGGLGPIIQLLFIVVVVAKFAIIGLLKAIWAALEALRRYRSLPSSTGEPSRDRERSPP